MRDLPAARCPDLGTSHAHRLRSGRGAALGLPGAGQARREYGGGTVALVDGDDRTFTYDDIIRASFALGSALKRGTRTGECVGVMLPTGAAATLAFFALSAYGRIPTMLNFTSGLAGLKSALAPRR